MKSPLVEEMECTEPLEKIDEALKSVFQTGGTDTEKIYTGSSTKQHG